MTVTFVMFVCVCVYACVCACEHLPVCMRAYIERLPEYSRSSLLIFYSNPVFAVIFTFMINVDDDEKHD